MGGALANLGVTLAGKTAVNLNFTAGEGDIKHAIERCGIATILSSRAFIEKAKLPEFPGIVYLEDVLPAFTSHSRKFKALGPRRAGCLRDTWLARLHRTTWQRLFFPAGAREPLKGSCFPTGT